MLSFALVSSLAESTAPATSLLVVPGDSANVIDQDQVDWDLSLSWGDQWDWDMDGVIDIDFQGINCDFNIDSFPLRAHCDSSIKVGLIDHVDIFMSVEMGAQIRMEQMNGMDQDPELDIYFAFKSPEVHWAGTKYIDSTHFPASGYYIATIPLKMGKVNIGTTKDGFYLKLCATDFRQYVTPGSPEEPIVNAVFDSLTLSGSDFCIDFEVAKTGSQSVDLKLDATLFALDDTRIDWGNYPEWLNALYSAIVTPICAIERMDGSNCVSNRDAFKWLREKITGLNTGYTMTFNVAEMIENLVDEQKVEWDEKAEDQKVGADYAKFVKSRQLVGARTQSFHLGQDDPQESTNPPNVALLATAGVVALCFLLLLTWMGLSKRKHGTFFHLPCAEPIGKETEPEATDAHIINAATTKSPRSLAAEKYGAAPPTHFTGYPTPPAFTSKHMVSMTPVKKTPPPAPRAVSGRRAPPPRRAKSPPRFNNGKPKNKAPKGGKRSKRANMSSKIQMFEQAVETAV